MVNFKIQELVSKEVYDLLGENAWKLFDSALLVDVDNLVSDLKKDLGCTAATVNNWYWEGNFTQSGFREKSSDVGSTGSMHRVGGALDLKFSGITVADAYNYLIRNQDRYTSINRVESLEDAPTWLHVDNKNMNRRTIYVFRA